MWLMFVSLMGKISQSLAGIGYQTYVLKKFNFSISYSSQCSLLAQRLLPWYLIRNCYCFVGWHFLSKVILLNKKSELVNTCRHQGKLLLKRFKNNWSSERSDTIDWYLVFDISGSVFDVSVCCNIFCSILTYSPFQKHSVFGFGLYNIFQQWLQGVL